MSSTVIDYFTKRSQLFFLKEDATSFTSCKKEKISQNLAQKRPSGFVMLWLHERYFSQFFTTFIGLHKICSHPNVHNLILVIGSLNLK